VLVGLRCCSSPFSSKAPMHLTQCSVAASHPFTNSSLTSALGWPALRSNATSSANFGCSDFGVLIALDGSRNCDRAAISRPTGLTPYRHLHIEQPPCGLESSAQSLLLSHAVPGHQSSPHGLLFHSALKYRNRTAPNLTVSAPRATPAERLAFIAVEQRCRTRNSQISKICLSQSMLIPVASAKN
jgi:hypothetical protein